MKPHIDWVIHGCANGVVCEIDGKTENGFMPGTCNFHTHGMGRYNHMDFQMTLGYPHKERPVNVSKTVKWYPEFMRIAMYV